MLYLTSPVKDYAVGKTYVPGDFVKDPGSGNVFEAIKKHTSKKKTSLTDTLLWAPKGLSHFITANQGAVELAGAPSGLPASHSSCHNTSHVPRLDS